MRRNNSDDSSQVIESIYAAALAPEAWTVAVDRATNFVGADRAMMLLWNGSRPESSVLVIHRVDQEALSDWQSEYLDDDVWAHAGVARFPDQHFVATGASLVSTPSLRKTRIYNDLFRPRKLLDLLTTSLWRDGPTLSALSFYSHRLFERPELQRLEALAPHFRLAAVLQRQLLELRIRADAGESVLDSLALGVFVLDSAGHLIRANRRGESILNQRDGLTVRNRRIRCASPDDDRALEAAVSRAAAAGEGRVVVAGQALSVSRPSRRRPLACIVSPIIRHHTPIGVMFGAGAGAIPSVLVTTTDPEDVELPSTVHLRALFGLTSAESRLAAALAAGQTLAEFAEQGRITVGTARWTLKQVLQKTGCRRQSELVRLLVSSAAHVARA